MVTLDTNLLIGTDPELFSIRDGRIVPAIQLLGDDRDVELPWGRAYADGAAIEFMTPPSDSVDQIVYQIGSNIRKLVNEFGPLSVQSCAPIDLNDIAASKGKGRGDMTILGCAPDVRVYHWTEMPIRPDPTKYPFRSVGAHIHLGLPGAEYLDGITFRQFVTAFMDAIIGTSFAIIGNDEHSRRRHTLYGLSGTVRYTNYGVEYRTTPALAIRDPHIAEATFGTAYTITQWIITYWEDQRQDYSALLSVLGGVDGMQEVQQAIDSGDITRCDHLRNEVLGRMCTEYYFSDYYILDLFNYRLPVVSSSNDPDFTVEW